MAAGDKKDQSDSAVVAEKLEQLLANNREPKVSELRTALLAGAAQGGTAAQEVSRFLKTKVSGASQALMGFCDLRRLYAETPIKCEMRPRSPDAPGVGGGLVAGVGLFSKADIQTGEVITEWEVHGVSSAWNNDTKRTVYYDPRLSKNVDFADNSISETKLAAEALTVSFGDSRFYHFPLAFTTCPYKLAHFANDTDVCPDPEGAGYTREMLLKYKNTATRANAAFRCELGIRAALVSTQPIAAGEEILVHWGTHHWQELRAMHRRGMRLAAMPQQETKEEGEDETKEEEEDAVSPKARGLEGDSARSAERPGA